MQRPVQAPVASIYVEKLMADWLLEHAQPKLKDPVRYHYRHLRPEYLREFVDGVESLWDDVGKLTKVHLRYQCDTKIVDMAPRIRRP